MSSSLNSGNPNNYDNTPSMGPTQQLQQQQYHHHHHHQQQLHQQQLQQLQQAQQQQQQQDNNDASGFLRASNNGIAAELDRLRPISAPPTLELSTDSLFAFRADFARQFVGDTGGDAGYPVYYDPVNGPYEGVLGVSGGMVAPPQAPTASKMLAQQQAQHPQQPHQQQHHHHQLHRLPSANSIRLDYPEDDVVPQDYRRLNSSANHLHQSGGPQQYVSHPHDKGNKSGSEEGKNPVWSPVPRRVSKFNLDDSNNAALDETNLLLPPLHTSDSESSLIGSDDILPLVDTLQDRLNLGIDNTPPTVRFLWEEDEKVSGVKHQSYHHHVNQPSVHGQYQPHLQQRSSRNHIVPQHHQLFPPVHNHDPLLVGGGMMRAVSPVGPGRPISPNHSALGMNHPHSSHMSNHPMSHNNMPSHISQLHHPNVPIRSISPNPLQGYQRPISPLSMEPNYPGMMEYPYFTMEAMQQMTGSKSSTPIPSMQSLDDRSQSLSPDMDHPDVILQNGSQTPICRFFAQGYCSRGDRCNYMHAPYNMGYEDIGVPVLKDKDRAKNNKSPRPISPPEVNSLIAAPIPTAASPPAANSITPPKAGRATNGANPAASRKHEIARLTSIDQVLGQVYSLCKDQHGCRFLQRKLEENNPRITEAIFNEVYAHIVELMTDPFGNYLCQKLLEYCNDTQRLLIVERVAGDLVSISKNMHGTRAVQKMIEYLNSPTQIQLVINALRSSVVALIQDLNGNHVIQRFLNKLSAEDNQFVYDAVAGHCVAVATHRHGCCVLQRCIDHAADRQKIQLVKEITSNALTLVQDPYGNYVVQYVLDLPYLGVAAALIKKFSGHLSQLSMQKFSSNVIEKCLNVADPATRKWMVEEFLESEILGTLLQDPFANYVIQTALTVSELEQHGRLVEAIKPHLPALRNTPYGKRIQNKIMKEGAAHGYPTGISPPLEDDHSSSDERSTA